MLFHHQFPLLASPQVKGRVSEHWQTWPLTALYLLTYYTEFPCKITLLFGQRWSVIHVAIHQPEPSHHSPDYRQELRPTKDLQLWDLVFRFILFCVNFFSFIGMFFNDLGLGARGLFPGRIGALRSKNRLEDWGT